YLEWPIDEGKGIDDRLAAIGPEKVLASIAAVQYGDWKAMLIRNDKGVVLPTHENSRSTYRMLPNGRGVIGYNEFDGRQYALRNPPPPVNATPGSELQDNFDTEAIRWFECHGMIVGADVMRRVIDSEARRNSCHPVREYLNSLKWDCKERIKTWLMDY